MNAAKILLIILILALTVLGGLALYKLRPEAERKEIVRQPPPVGVVEAEVQTVPVTLRSQGVVEARTLTQAASEVAGRIEWVSPQFETGGTFSKGDVLLRIEQADYELALAEAQASLTEALLNVEMEQAKAEQAERDWAKLGQDRKPTDLVLRKPQLASAQARAAAARALVEKAGRDLEKTELRAPYDGRLLATHVDLGTFITVGAPLADFYQSTNLEVSLPLSLDEHSLLPHTVLDTTTVDFTATAGDRNHTWSGKVVRQSAEIDRQSRSIHLIATIANPSSPDSTGILVPGLFVKASIMAKPLDNVVPLPRRALREGGRVIVVDPDNRIDLREVEVAYKDRDMIYVSRHIQDGERVCVTDLPAVIDAMEVRITEDTLP